MIHRSHCWAFEGRLQGQDERGNGIENAGFLFLLTQKVKNFFPNDSWFLVYSWLWKTISTEREVVVREVEGMSSSRVEGMQSCALLEENHGGNNGGGMYVANEAPVQTTNLGLLVTVNRIQLL